MKIKKLTKSILAVVVFLFICQLIVSARLSFLGKNVSSLEDKYHAKSEENGLLEQKIASESALLTIEEKAKTLGFNSKSNIEFLDSSIQLVKR